MSRFRAVQGDQAAVGLEELGRAYFEFSQEFPAEYRVMFGRKKDFGEYPHLVEASGEAFFMLLCSVQALMPVGATQTQAVPNALLTWSMIHGYANLMQLGAFQFIDASVVPTPEGMAKSLAAAIGS